jgi:phosphoenolpyruvate carboxylase
MSQGGRRPAGAALRDFASDEALLTEVLHDVVRTSDGHAAGELLDNAVALGRAARGGDEAAGDHLAALVASLDLDQTEVLVRSLTRWFQLVNLAEDNQRVRRLRRRDARDAPAPRRGSMRHAIAELATRGTTAAELGELLRGAELRLVMTAHPTEARRRTTIDKLARLFGVLRELDDVAHADPVGARRRLLATVQELWGSDELRAASLTVLEEVRGGLIHFATTLAETVPRVYRDLEEALAEFYPGERFEVPPLLSFGSWIGGDRDGNPFVTPAATVQALELMREQCLRFLEGRVELLAGRLSLSDRVGGAAPGLEPILTAGDRPLPGAGVAAGGAQPRGAVSSCADVRARAGARHDAAGRRSLPRARGAARRPSPGRAIAASVRSAAAAGRRTPRSSRSRQGPSMGD